MLNKIFFSLKSLLSRHRENSGKRFIEKFALATQVTTEKIDEIKSDLCLDIQTAVKATLLIDAYGIHLALSSDSARKLIQYTDKNKFETAMLSRYVEESIKKLSIDSNANGLYEEISQHIKSMDSEFYANITDMHDPFYAATKRFLRIICGKDYADLAVMTIIAGGIGSQMKYTIEMFEGLYENGYRY